MRAFIWLRFYNFFLFVFYFHDVEGVVVLGFCFSRKNSKLVARKWTRSWEDFREGKIYLKNDFKQHKVNFKKVNDGIFLRSWMPNGFFGKKCNENQLSRF